jgi:hypothetical protein
VITNKAAAFTEPLLLATELAPWFGFAVSGDSLPEKKPHPMPLLHACERMGTRPAENLHIGDSRHDAAAARAAGCPVFIVPYGYNEGDDVQGIDCDAIVASLAEAARRIARIPDSRKPPDHAPPQPANDKETRPRGGGLALAGLNALALRAPDPSIAPAHPPAHLSLQHPYPWSFPMTESEFNRLAAEGYNRIPVTLETFADLDTPLSIYLKLANDPYSYLLESVQGGERFGRYSFIGLAAGTRIAVVDGAIMVLTGNRVAERRDHTNPMSFISEFMARFKVPDLPGLPRFCGGLVGASATTRCATSKPNWRKRKAKPDPLGVPDILLLLSEEIAIVDNLSGKLTLVVYAEPGLPRRLEAGPGRLKELLAKLRAPVAIPDEVRAPSAPAVSEFGEEAFKAAVRRAKQYIVDGDIMQVVLSQRMSKPFAASPLALYRALRTLNPSPYMFYFNFEDFHVVGASPEILVRLEDQASERRVTVRPIAGTRKRGATPPKTRRWPPTCWPTPRSAPST